MAEQKSAVLCIDDDEGTRKLYSAVLGVVAQIAVTTCASGMQAVAEIEAGALMQPPVLPNVIITDHNTGEKEFADEAILSALSRLALRTDIPADTQYTLRAIPVIVVSGDELDAQELQSSGIREVIVMRKPTNMAELRGNVERLLGIN